MSALLAFLLSAHAAPSDLNPPDVSACDLSPPAAAEIHLVTVSPGAAPFSFIGHSSLWLRVPERGIDHLVEFGAINSDKQEPLSALLLGDLRCWWAGGKVASRVRKYTRAERRSTAQRLLLDAETVAALESTLVGSANAGEDAPEAFHWQSNSCASRVRDLIDDAHRGALRSGTAEPAPLNPRQEVLRHLQEQWWAWLGWGFLAGRGVDRPVARWDALFAPQRLSQAVDELGLVGPACQLTDGAHAWPKPSPPRWAARLWGIGGLLAAGVLVLARRGHRRTLTALVSAWAILFGVLGALGMALAATSALDAYGSNENWWQANPATLLLPLCLGRSWGRPVVWGLLGLSTVGLLLEVTPWNQQDNLAFIGLIWPVLVAVALTRGRRPADSPPPPGGTAAVGPARGSSGT